VSTYVLLVQFCQGKEKQDNPFCKLAYTKRKRNPVVEAQKENMLLTNGIQQEDIYIYIYIYVGNMHDDCWQAKINASLEVLHAIW